jgi:hypothetical protein
VGVATETEAVASQMTQLLSTQIQTAFLAQANRPETAEIANKLHISAEGNRMQLSLALTKDELVKQLVAAQAAGMQAGRTSPSRPTPPPVRQPKPSNPGQITIYGLEGGPRVIQSAH